MFHLLSRYLLLVPCAALSVAAARAPDAQPNIVLIVADDLGYGDLSAYGCPDIRTPVIDSLATRGIRLTQFYANGPSCSPTRAALMTGRYQQRVGGFESAIGLGGVGRYSEAAWLEQRHDLGLPASENTLAMKLQAAGYATAVVGKWHLGYEEKFGPQHHGFDESFIVLGAAADYITHREPDGAPQLRHNGKPITAEGYMTDILVDRAVSWLGNQKAGQPYFLYLPLTAPHEPFQGPGDGPAALPWKKGSRAEGTRDIYRRMVEHMDKRLGDVLAAVDCGPNAVNTLVVFISDNGAMGIGSNLPLRGFKAQVWEGGIRVPCLMTWPQGLPKGREISQVMLTMDLHATLLAAARIPEASRGRLDGLDLTPVLRGEQPVVTRTIFWRAKAARTTFRAVRDGDLKLVDHNGKRALIDLADDPAEVNNLLESRPADAERLGGLLAAWEAEVAAPRLAEFYAHPPASAAERSAKVEAEP